MHAHAFLHRQADRARLQHLRPDRGQFEHFLVGDFLQFSRARHDPRVGGVDTIDIGVDVAAIGLHRRRDRHRRGVRSTAPERGDAGVVIDALKTGDDRDFARRETRVERGGVDSLDPRRGVRIARRDRELPAEPAPRRDARRLQRDREQAAGDLLAGRDDDVILGRIIERRRLAAEADQPVGLARHRRYDHRDLVARRHFTLYPRRDRADPLDPRHRSAAEFHHDTGHGVRGIPWEGLGVLGRS